MAVDFFCTADSPSSESREQSMLLIFAKILFSYPAVALKLLTPVTGRPQPTASRAAGSNRI
jgi:hypothetical protein